MSNDELIEQIQFQAWKAEKEERERKRGDYWISKKGREEIREIWGYDGNDGSTVTPLINALERVEVERDRLKTAIQEIIALCPDADPYDSAGPTSRGYYLALRDIKHRLMLELNTVTTIE
jgi:hypothetical protein